MNGAKVRKIIVALRKMVRERGVSKEVQEARKET